jgi:hypothetical protein
VNPFEMVVMIVGIIAISRVLQAKYGRHGDDRFGRFGRFDPMNRRQGLHDVTPPQDDAETRRLRDEVTQLKQRLQVLERITVDKENSLAREIDQLRDR